MDGGFFDDGGRDVTGRVISPIKWCIGYIIDKSVVNSKKAL
jgi:hypothetical protein